MPHASHKASLNCALTAPCTDGDVPASSLTFIGATPATLAARCLASVSKYCSTVKSSSSVVALPMSPSFLPTSFAEDAPRQPAAKAASRPPNASAALPSPPLFPCATAPATAPVAAGDDTCCRCRGEPRDAGSRGDPPRAPVGDAAAAIVPRDSRRGAVRAIAATTPRATPGDPSVATGDPGEAGKAGEARIPVAAAGDGVPADLFWACSCGDVGTALVPFMPAWDGVPRCTGEV
mmetsp:Transcript_88022/g.188872  ORF Transcript_88022/g.188872 Transcript_88022/m.188872 type:complete len:235 (+) Transcript_88022:915-1619(+)